jgi:hypothetical protein
MSASFIEINLLRVSFMKFEIESLNPLHWKFMESRFTVAEKSSFAYSAM